MRTTFIAALLPNATAKVQKNTDIRKFSCLYQKKIVPLRIE